MSYDKVSYPDLVVPVVTGRHGLLSCVKAGSGPAVVLIHGTGADAESNWGPLIATLSSRYTVLAPNLPGAGDTPAPIARLELNELAAQVGATISAHGIVEGFHLVGHSLGAVVAAAVAAGQPEQVRSLLLHAGWATTGPREALMFDLWSRLLRTDPGLLARQLVLDAMSPALLHNADSAQLADMVAGFTSMLDTRILGQIELDGRIDVARQLPGVRAETLVLCSTDDRIIPPPLQRALAELIHCAAFREVAGGHGLPFENPVAFFAAVSEWVDGQQARIERAA